MLILKALRVNVLPAITVGKCENILLIIVQHRDAALSYVMHTN